MASKTRLIIDTDPGVDDILAMLLAFSAQPDVLEIVAITVTFGNVEVVDCLRNVVALFHVISKEKKWRRSIGRPSGFELLETCKPIVAVGATAPLADQLMMADYFHGRDGLGGVHTSHPHLTPPDAWRELFGFQLQGIASSEVSPVPIEEQQYFTPSTLPAHQQILQILRENPKDTITIVAIGPLTNLALASAEDAETLLRAKEVVVMGGALRVPGNITPCAEFNFMADAFAAARVLALTSPNPSTTMPPTPPLTDQNHAGETLGPYPESLSRPLKLTLLPLDITTEHLLSPSTFAKYSEAALQAGSPLAEWTTAFLSKTFLKATEVQGGLSLHDPLAVWYAEDGANHTQGSAEWNIAEDQDVRVEAIGQWTRGYCAIDEREQTSSKRKNDPDVGLPVSGDAGGWRSERRGNRVRVVTKTSVMGSGQFGELACQRLFN